MGIALSVLLFDHALQRTGATRTSASFLPTTALAGVAGGALPLGERLAPAHGLGLLLVLAGAWLLGTEGRAPHEPRRH